MKRVLWFCLFLFVGVSCLDQPDCFRQDVNLIGISFRKMYDGKSDTVALFQASTALTDTTLTFYSKKYVTSISLPLNYLQNNTTFAIEKIVRDFLTEAYEKDTITVGHRTKVQFVSEDCGERFVVSNLELLKFTYDSIALLSNSPSNPAHVNIAVYRCPRTNVMRLSFRQLYMDETDVNSRGKLDSRPITLISNGGTPLWADTTLSAVLLPLDPNATTTTYDFKFDNGDEHSLTLKYDIGTSTFVSMCGTQNYYHKLGTVTTANGFGILNIAKDTLKDPPVTNIETFRCPITNEIKVLFRQTRGSSKVTDTLHTTSIKADYLADALYTDSSATYFTLPLNPLAGSTKYTFEVTQESKSEYTLQVDYATDDFTTHSDVCPGLKKFTVITKNEGNTSFYTSDINVLDAAAKFPASNNIEIIRK